MHIFIFNSNPAVDYDVDQYRRLLDSKGGSLGDATTPESDAIERLRAYTAKRYAIVGRSDVWLLKPAYQIGSGSKCYSFLGLEGSLVNGPTWSTGGIANTVTSDRYTQLPHPWTSKPLPIIEGWVGTIDSDSTSYRYLFSSMIAGATYDFIGPSHAVVGSTRVLTSGVRTNISGAWTNLNNFGSYTLGEKLSVIVGSDGSVVYRRLNATDYNATAATTIEVGAYATLGTRPDAAWTQNSAITSELYFCIPTAPSAAKFTALQAAYNSSF